MTTASVAFGIAGLLLVATSVAPYLWWTNWFAMGTAAIGVICGALATLIDRRRFAAAIGIILSIMIGFTAFVGLLAGDSIVGY